MGTKSTEDLQGEIKSLIHQLGWSQRKLGKELYTARYEEEDDDEQEISKFEEKVRKDLQRKTIKPEVLQSYLEIIYRHPDFLRIDQVRSVYFQDGVLDSSLELELKRISKKLTKDLKSKSLYEE